MFWKAVTAGRFRPLAGMNCNEDVLSQHPHVFWFPSPRGDELQLLESSQQTFAQMFPSPRGDELQPGQLHPQDPAAVGFRPLAGMNCNLAGKGVGKNEDEFPSPRGDELQQDGGKQQ